MKKVLITGCNRGLGKEVALQLAKKGFMLIATARKRKEGKKAVEELKKESGNEHIHFVELDVSSSRDMHTIIQELRSLGIHDLDVMINNAGVFIDKENATTVSKTALEKTFETNFYGPLTLSQKLLPLLKKSNDGRIINVSSGMGALNGMEGGHAAYRISKSALNSFTVILAAELKNENIKVVSVCPGWVKTDMGGSQAERQIQEGAYSISQLAWKEDLQSANFYRDGKIIAW